MIKISLIFFRDSKCASNSKTNIVSSIVHGESNYIIKDDLKFGDDLIQLIMSSNQSHATQDSSKEEEIGIAVSSNHIV